MQETRRTGTRRSGRFLVVLMAGMLGGEHFADAAEALDGPPEPQTPAPAVAGAKTAGSKASATGRPAPAPKTAGGGSGKKAVAIQLKGPVPPPPPQPEGTVVATKQAPLKLAPSAAEIEAERRAPPGQTPAVPVPVKRDPREVTPNQNPNWPTHVDNTRGPGSSVGAGTAGDRKATVQDASGPQTGVIRNRF